MLRLLLPLLLLVSISGLAYQVEPMIQHFSMVGSQSQGIYHLTNTSHEPLTVKVEVFKRAFDSRGEERLIPASEDFLVTPPQAQIAPGKIQSFRTRYLGQAPLRETTSYRIIFRQLPSQDDATGSSVDLLINFATLVFVSPPGTQAKPVVRIATDKNTNHVVIRNQGNGVLNLENWELVFTKAGRSQRVGWPQLRASSPFQFIMPGQEKAIELQPAWYQLAGIPDSVTIQRR